ncbi:SDR family NAD(P)-dependent oxidoreductase [Pararobbsia silviterrae]|uniref:Glucose 1-dehydrogenase n=1 Tax=Pararobbsia silviterrae TaxID=1792498 RepID=A0A494XG75_9BURK|nr:glucose 1-dehydrogenase [Pararobbsia silviterrae]RKP47149.1 glucose 1-dehydrogenase [Pararobbsia silviterrae]
MKRYEGKVALITGGLGAFGKAIAARLVEEGARAMLGDLSVPSADTLEGAFGEAAERIAGVRLDVTSAESWDQAVAETYRRFGRFDVLVNNAGTLSPAPAVFDEIGLDEWRRVFAVNVDGCFLGVQAALRAMKSAPDGGVIVNMGSIAGYVGSKDNGAYGASKSAVRNLTKQAAISAARLGYNVRVNAVHPGYAWTPLVEAKLTEQYGSREAAMQFMRSLNPLGRIVEPRDVAAAVAFLGSDDARMITGGDLIVDAGRLAQ